MSMEVTQGVGKHRAVYLSPAWHTLVALKDELFASWAQSSPTSSTEWGFVHDSLKREGRIEGVMAFLKEIENRANQE
jgi:hypothetical protein